LQQFTGEIRQIPPAYSAIKVNGQRAYKLARAGKEVKIEPRAVTIYSIAAVNYSYPSLKFTAKVSSGTYIRSLVMDIGEVLGTGAYMSDLRRTQIGEFLLLNAVPVPGIDT
jgi:tRNA pseudouridine55 synthase